MSCSNKECDFYDTNNSKNCQVWDDDCIEEYCKKYTPPKSKLRESLDDYQIHNELDNDHPIMILNTAIIDSIEELQNK